jgi:hypothetical protein
MLPVMLPRPCIANPLSLGPAANGQHPSPGPDGFPSPCAGTPTRSHAPRTRLDARASSSGKGAGRQAAGEGPFQHHAAARLCAIQRRRDRPPMWKTIDRSDPVYPYCKLFVCHEEPGTEPGIFRKYMKKTCSNNNAVSILIRLSPSPPAHHSSAYGRATRHADYHIVGRD